MHYECQSVHHVEVGHCTEEEEEEEEGGGEGRGGREYQEKLKEPDDDEEERGRKREQDEESRLSGACVPCVRTKLSRHFHATVTQRSECHLGMPCARCWRLHC